MAFNPGRNIGRVSIRVLPDTKHFNRDLRRQIEKNADRITATVTIDKVNLDRTKIKADMQRQINAIDLDGLDADIRVTIDRAKLAKVALRKSIQEQFDKFDKIAVKIDAEVANVERFHRQVRKMISDAENNKLNIFANPQTALAAAQFRYTARDRIVQFIAHANEGALIKTATALAALSGARLAGTWTEDLVDFTKDLDKSLPRILNWTSGITAVVAALSASVSGLVGIGQGLFSITPALLVLPGLLINSIGSLTALFVAWRNGSKELQPLAAGMREIGDIINTTYWDRARQPILDLVNGLMPQLRNSFRDLSEGVGDFTAEFARAFGEELSGGRLESIFAGIAEGWRVLATGASGFAGAIVSLSQIAATYTPRLAGWFVRQANTFDTWLKAISEDGRLGAWMEGAIDSMYDLWDATRGMAGVFAGIWKAADQAGSGGLKGFAQMMLEWRRVVNGADFQRGLSAIFRGSYVAMDAFGEAIKSLGRLVSDMPGQFERFVGSVGGFLGGIFDEAFKALNNVNVAVGLDQFSAGLDAALAGIKPALDPIAATFGNFLGLLGDLARNLLPTAAGVLADLMPAIDGIIRAVERVLPGLGEAVRDFSSEVGPALADLVETLSPAFVAVMETLGEVFKDMGPSLRDLVRTVGPELTQAIRAITPILENISLNPAVTAIEFLGDPSVIFDQAKLSELLEKIKGRGGLFGDMATWAEDFGTQVGLAIRSAVEAIVRLPETIGEAIVTHVPRLIPIMIDGAVRMFDGFLTGLEYGIINVGSWLAALPERIRALVGDARSWLSGTGSQVMSGFAESLATSYVSVGVWFAMLPARIAGALGNAARWLVHIGDGIIQGLLDGLKTGFERVKKFVRTIAPWIQDNKGPESYDRQLLVAPGEWIMGGLERGLARGFNRVKSRVSGMAGEIRGEFESAFASDVQLGFGTSVDAARATSASSKFKGDPFATSEGAIQVVHNGDNYAYDPTELARQQREQLTRALDALPTIP